MDTGSTPVPMAEHMTKGERVLTRLTMFSLIGLVMGLALGGCGEDSADSTATVTTSQLTKAQFIERADALCLRETNRALEQGIGSYIAREAPGSGKSEADVRNEAIIAVLLPALERQVAQVRQLGAPVGDEEQVEAILTTMQSSIDAARKDPPTAKDVRVAGVELRNKFVPLDRLGRAYGFDSCAYGGLR